MCAILIPPYGGDRPAIVLSKDEALTVLATLNANPSYANSSVRDTLVKYIERLRDE
jgi:hypothetical protein